MSSVREDLENFNAFAAGRLTDAESARSLDDLFAEWCEQRDRDEINQAIRQGLADVDAGRHEPAEKAIEAIRQEFDFPNP